MSLLQTEHLSVPDIAFNPPQLPLIFLFIKITPKDIITIIIRNITNVKTKISIFSYTTLNKYYQLMLFFKSKKALLSNFISLLSILSMKRTAIFSFSAIFNPSTLPKAKSAVAQPSAFIEFL